MGTLVLTAVLCSFAAAQLAAADVHFAALGIWLPALWQNFWSARLLSELFNILLSLPVGAWLFGLVYGAARRDGPPCDGPAFYKALAPYKRLPRLTCGIATGALCALYSLFFALQLAEWTAAMGGPGLTAPEASAFAVDGFWELLRIQLLDIAVLAGVHFLAKRPLPKVLAALFCGFGVAFALLAGAKLAAYIRLFGFTPRRVAAGWFLTVLLVWGVLLLVRVFKPIPAARIGIAVLVVVVLAAAWVAAPHVLDWATHTWYTVVRDRDLSASSAVSESASSGAQSTAASEPAASSVPEKEPEPEVKGTDIVTGLWAEVDVATLTDEAAIRSAARQLKAQGMTYAILTLKDTAGQVYYASQTAVGAANAAPTQVELTSVASIFKEEGLVPVAALTAFRDPAGARADHALAIRYQGQEYLWLDNKASAGGNPWLNPYAAETVQYIGDLIAEVHAAGFDQVLLENVQFPSSTSAKQDYGTTNGVSRAGQLTADIAAWQARFGDTVTLWYGYSLAEVTGSSSQLGAPAAQLGVKNLLVKVPSSSTLDAAAREELTLSLTEAGVEHLVIRDDAASYFE